MKKLVLIVTLFVIIVGSITWLTAHHRSNNSAAIRQSKTHKQPPFKKGLPKIIRGTYYREELSHEPLEDDLFYRLVLTAKGMFQVEFAEKDHFMDYTEYSYQQLPNNAFIIEQNDTWLDFKRYYKVVHLRNGDLKLSKDFSSVKQASRAKNFQKFFHHQPDPGFGLSEIDLTDSDFQSTQDFTRYYHFRYQKQEDGASSYDLHKIESDGYLVELKHSYKAIAKKDKYLIIDGRKPKEYVTLLKIDQDTLKNEQTGETFTHYKDKTLPILKQIRREQGFPDDYTPPSHMISSPMPATSTKPKPKYKDKYHDPSYDPDSDDDYLDDYNQAEFEDEF